MHKVVVVLGEGSGSYFFLHVLQPFVVLSLALMQFCDALQAGLWPAPHERLPVAYRRGRLVLACLQYVIHRNASEETAVRRL